MKYELKGIERFDTFETDLYLFDQAWVHFVRIPWPEAKMTQLYLNPINIGQISAPLRNQLEIIPKEQVPIFDLLELRQVVNTAVGQTRVTRSKHKPPFMSVFFDADYVRSVTSTADLVLKTVVVPGEKVQHGLLIDAVAIPWFEIIEMLKKNPKLAFEIPPRKWEEIIAGAYKKAGFDEVILTPASGDLGRDVIATKRGLWSVRVIDQVKAYKPGHLVTANDARALLGVVTAERVSKGFLTTTSDFAPKLKDDELLRPFIPFQLELVNGTALLKRLEEIARKGKDDF